MGTIQRSETVRMRVMKTITRKMVVPDWANWIAQDQGGDWFVYEFVPVENQFGWEAPDGKEVHLYEGLPKKAWRRTLQRI